MPDTRISDLTVLTAPAAGDLIPIVDISDTTMAASGTTKRVTQAVLSSSILASAQPLDATLTALAGLTIAADSLAIGTGADAFTQTTFAANTLPARASTGSLAAKPITDFGLSLIDDAAASNARTTLGLAIGTDVLAYQPTQIQFGGSTSSFPMLLRSSTILKARLADNSDYAQVQAQTFGNKDAGATSSVLDFSSTASMFPQFLVDNASSSSLTQIRLNKKESGSNTLTNGGEVGLIAWNTMSFLKGIATANVTGGYSTVDLALRTTNAAGTTANRVRFTAEGQVGIGEESPSGMLHIAPSAAATKGIFIKGAASQTGNYLEVVTSASAGVCKLTTNSAATVFNLHLGQINATQSLIFSTTVTDARIESDGYGLSLRSRDGTQYVSIFTKSTTVAAFSVDANATMKYGQGITGISTSSWTIQGVVSRTAQNGSVTYNDSSSTGTVATVCLNSMAGQNISATAATTYTNASTLYLESTPNAGANVTMTNRWSLHTSGGAYVEGTLQLAGGASLLKTQAALTAGSTANVPTLSSGPVTGNPTKWIAINDAGTTRYIPTW